MSWRPKEGWVNPYKKVRMKYQEQTEAIAFEDGADNMHKADVEWLKQYPHSDLKGTGEGISGVAHEIRIPLDDWQDFEGV